MTKPNLTENINTWISAFIKSGRMADTKTIEGQAYLLLWRASLALERADKFKKNLVNETKELNDTNI